ncbi:MAG: 2-hydroxyacid dehydrogenase [Bacteroidota bacterium]
MDVYFYEAFKEEEEALRQHLEPNISFDLTSNTVQETGHESPPARLISIRTQSIIPAEWSSAIDGILSRSTGYDHLKAYQSKIQTPLPCGYLEEYATQAVAEHAILLMMSLFRKLPSQEKQFLRFQRDGLTGRECRGKNLLVVGVGRIGSEIVHIGQGLGMNVYGVDLVQRLDSLKYCEKEEGIAWADAVICAMNLTKFNRGYFSYSLLKKAKPGAVFVNIARGEHASTADLIMLEEERHLGGIGLDVYEDEPMTASEFRSGTSDVSAQVRKLLSFPNVLLTPHNAFNTAEAVERKSRLTTEQVEYFLKNRKFKRQL